MQTEFFLRGALDEEPPFLNGERPDPVSASFYRAQTSFWYLTPDPTYETCPQVDLNHTCRSGDIITPETQYKSLWFYKPESKELFIPIANAQLIISRLYRAVVPIEVAQEWLRTLEFSQRYDRADTCSLFAGVKFDGCEPFSPKMTRCIVLDMSKPDEREVTNEEWYEMQDKAKAGDIQFAKPYEWRKRKKLLAKAEASSQFHAQLDRLTRANGSASLQHAKITSKRTALARQAHSTRMAKRYGRGTPEFEQAMQDYDNGVRRPRGRQDEEIQLRQNTQIRVSEYVRKLAHPEVNLFYGDLAGARRSGDIRSSDAPIVHTSSLLAPTRFHTDLAQATYDVANRPLAWAINTREVRVPIGSSSSNEYHEVRTQITQVAVVERALSLEMANYSQAMHYVATRREKNPVTHHMDMVAVFDIDHIASGRLRARRPSEKPSLQAQLDALTERLTATEEKLTKLGKAFHALMGVIKDLEERVSQSDTPVDNGDPHA